ncbi:uncharacterized protein TrAtP1_003795 [Trichoderma atroviride]|uniref:uncharacterized protein n=1 Tax=Hypocrea atroviridis TaxID=63577 RepID=UPI003329F7A2|nr:hypothetical protein TrAtP1_003795 [Trichoderma atroviride]
MRPRGEASGFPLVGKFAYKKFPMLRNEISSSIVSASLALNSFHTIYFLSMSISILLFAFPLIFPTSLSSSSFLLHSLPSSYIPPGSIPSSLHTDQDPTPLRLQPAVRP